MVPELTSDQARRLTPATVLGDWASAPTVSRAATLTADPSEPLQHAINRAIRLARDAAAPDRIVIALGPGQYDGPAVLPDLRIGGRSVPITLIGAGADRTSLVADIHARLSGQDYHRRFGPLFDAATPEVQQVRQALPDRSEPVGTPHSAVLTLAGDRGELCDLTIRNSYNCDRTGDTPPEADAVCNKAGQWSDETHQAVALAVTGARARLSGLRLLSYQDTLYLAGQGAYLTKCQIAGDVDFIFGPSAAWFEACEIRSLGTRSPNSWAVAPSTPLSQDHGFVFSRCAFTHDHSPAAGLRQFKLGRQWFSGVRATPYGAPDLPDYRVALGAENRLDGRKSLISRATLEAVGKCHVIRSTIGSHISPGSAWDDWKGREYAPSGRLRPWRWHPRYRPVQFQHSDLTHHLRDWEDAACLTSPSDAAMPFLGAYHTTWQDPADPGPPWHLSAPRPAPRRTQHA